MKNLTPDRLGVKGTLSPPLPESILKDLNNSFLPRIIDFHNMVLWTGLITKKDLESLPNSTIMARYSDYTLHRFLDDCFDILEKPEKEGAKKTGADYKIKPTIDLVLGRGVSFYREDGTIKWEVKDYRLVQ